MGRLNMTRELELGCFGIGFCDAIDSQTLRAMAAVSESATVRILDDWSQPWNLCYPVNAWQPRDGETFYKAGARWYRDHRKELLDAVVAEAKKRAEAHKE